MAYQNDFDDYSAGADEKRDADFEDKGAVFAKHKPMIILLFVSVAIMAVAFILYATDVISLLVMDCIMIPIAVLVLAFVYAKKNGRI